MSNLRIPVATYRVQFNKHFRFADAQVVVPYLHRLGISDLYASPILAARQGSLHGYDVTDPTRLNPELGTGQDFETLTRKLMAHRMGLLLDIVPNHMAANPENPWWMDILENGPGSFYSTFFDIDWSPPGSTLKNKVLCPILVSPYQQTLENRELTLLLEEAGFFVRYHNFKLPLSIKSYVPVISHRLNALESSLGFEHADLKRLKRLVDDIERLPSHTSPDYQKASEVHQEEQVIKEELWHIINTSPKVKAFLQENIALFNGKRGDPQSFDFLNRILSQQAYRLDFWKTAPEEINHRRFLDIADLVGIRIEEPQVFEAMHSLVFALVREGKVTGLRVDHIDGLYDPLEYLCRLQHYLAQQEEEISNHPGFYIVVEKILAGDETLPEEWPVFGTTGYDFLNTVNSLFVDEKGIQTLDRAYCHFTGSEVASNDVAYQKKKQVAKELFPGEMNSLGYHLACLAQQNWHITDLSLKELTKALIEITAGLPIYRTYARTLETSPRDRPYLERAVQEAKRQNPALEPTVLDLLKRVLLFDLPSTFSREQREAWLHFVLRWQQLTGAIVAKGVEDTALYTYNRLVSLNEVGADPMSTGLSVEEFHRRALSRLAYPYTLNATATHDTKRGEDIRARINVLSEIPEAWERCLARWSRWNQEKKQKVNALLVPESNMEILLYQTLIGAWPLLEEEVVEFKERLKVYMVKAAREAKAFTNWLSPSLEYESALISFLDSILESSDQNRFLRELMWFQRRVAYYGALNALAQVLLKITSPGVPDFYQGTELWDFSLVDPDNRRPVDFEKRVELLDDLIQQEVNGQHSLVQQLLNSWEDGRVKLYLTYKALNVRRFYRELFSDGDYIPLQVLGQRQEHICAFGRRKGEMWTLVVVPRLLTKLVRVGTLPLGRRVWGDDLIILPEGVPEHWLNTFTGETTCPSSYTRREMRLSSILNIFPVALMMSI